jgi:hypothetical protein
MRRNEALTKLQESNGQMVENVSPVRANQLNEFFNKTLSHIDTVRHPVLPSIWKKGQSPGQSVAVVNNPSRGKIESEKGDYPGQDVAGVYIAARGKVQFEKGDYAGQDVAGAPRFSKGNVESEQGD